MDLQNNLFGLYKDMSALDELVKPHLEDAATRNQPSCRVRFLASYPTETFRFDIDYFRIDGDLQYSLERFRGVFIPPITIPDINVQGVNTKELESRMATVPWDILPAYIPESRQNPWDLLLDEHSASGKKLLKDDMYEWMTRIYDDLVILCIIPEGKNVSDLLELKFASHTPMMHGSYYQQELDMMDEKRGASYVFDMSSSNEMSFLDAARMLKGELPLPPPYQNKIYQLSVEQTNLNYFEVKERTSIHTIIDNTKRQYFSTIEKAFDHACLIDDRQFFPGLMQREGKEKCIKHVTISDELSGTPLVSKVVFDGSLRDGSAVLGWAVHMEHYSPEQFIRDLNKPIGSLVGYEIDPSKFFIARERDLDKGGKENKQPIRKKIRRGGNRLN